MNKSFLGLAISTLFMVGAAHADVNPNDVSATLSVSGSVTHEFSCSVKLGSSVVTLQGDIDKLPTPSQTARNGIQTVEISLAGDEECTTMAGQGKIAYSFLGAADNATGTTLANTNVGTDGAKGVGIALYSATGAPLVINQDTMIAAAAPAVNHLGLDLVKLDGQEATAGAVQGALTIQINRL
ncbi:MULTISPECIES: fimbrial protein [Enterobacteriaceae]|uniref:Fimbrial protein n=1 Tax=Enterobacter sp. (strain 638) TaxID=399742 RepID=A0A9J9GDB0_ENT38|nr:MULTISPECIES: fimbrial protein [Enterobacteriaceae]ABP58772.1 Fimbrial protein [Enterobacter sp. 638]UJD92854.1 fimbrial protein [Lelliottia amnigena]